MDLNRLGTCFRAPGSVAEARAIQRALRKKVRIHPLRKQPRFVAGLDASFSGGKTGRVRAAACLFTYPGLTPVEDSTAEMEISFPYVPGLLTFREGPALLRALSRLKQTPDLLLFDGQGIAHPEGMGIASHMGLLLHIPSIGCAKSRLVGEHREPGMKRGSRARLILDGRTVGAVLRTRDGVKPVFVSPGHGIDLEGAIRVVLRCASRYRLPEPLRRADHLSRKQAALLYSPGRR